MNRYEHFPRFQDMFNVLAITHRLQGSDDLRGKMQTEYFDVLESYPIEAVEFAYQSLRRKMKKWPVPADWLEALPPYGGIGRLPLASPAEITESDAAESLGYEAASVCTCRACVEAGCFMPPRFVPRLDRDGNVMDRRHPDRQGRALTLGRWIHGAELKAWYASRAAFYEQLYAIRDAEKMARFLPRPADTQKRIANLANFAKWRIADTKAPKEPPADEAHE